MQDRLCGAAGSANRLGSQHQAGPDRRRAPGVAASACFGAASVQRRAGRRHPGARLRPRRSLRRKDPGAGRTDPFPRDLYDVVSFFRNGEIRSGIAVVREALEEKCRFKGIAAPRRGDLDPHRADLEHHWDAMLAPQLLSVPPVDAIWTPCPNFLLAGRRAGCIAAAAVAAGAGRGDGPRTYFEPALPPQEEIHLEVVRFSAANRLCVDLDYDGSAQRVEPYSLRRTPQGDFVLHAWDERQRVLSGYRLDRIQGARMTKRSFSPRHQIELVPEMLPPRGARRALTARENQAPLRFRRRPGRRPAAPRAGGRARVPAGPGARRPSKW